MSPYDLVSRRAKRYAKGCKDPIVRGALELAYIAGAMPLLDLLPALKALRADEWRCTVDWGPTKERHAINKACDAAIAKAQSRTAIGKKS